MARKLPARFAPLKKARLLGVALVLWGSSCEDGAPPPPPASVLELDPAAFPSPVLTFEAPPPPEAPRRIVSLVPSVTEALFVLGLGDRLVGRSEWCDWPPETAAIPSVGRQQDLSAERVADLRPDLVCSWSHLKDLNRALAETFKLRLVVPGTETKEEIFDGVVAVAEACGVGSRGAALVAEMRRGLDAVRARYAGRPTVRTLAVLDREPLFAPGATSFVDEMLRLVGAENVAAAGSAGRAWTPFSAEKILDWNPEVVLDLSLGDARSVDEARSFWARFPAVNAVRDGRVRLAAAGVVVRPGPRMAAAAAFLGRAVHGS